MKNILLLLGTAFLSLMLPGQAPASPPQEDHVTIRALPERVIVKGGETVTVGLEQTIADGWHTYWLNPGDSGTAARIKWSGLEGLKDGPVQWPFPKRLPVDDLVNFGFEGKAVLLQDLTLPKNLPDGPIALQADIDILVCHEICIPESHTVRFELNGADKAAAASVELARGKLPRDGQDVHWAARAGEENGDFVLTLTSPTRESLEKQEIAGRAGTIEIYPEEWGLIQNNEKTRAEAKDAALVIRHKRGERALAEAPETSNFVLVYQNAQGERRAIAITARQDKAGAGETATQAETQQQKDLSPFSFLTAIFYALLGGLILNLMPCVFPVLSMKALSLVKLKDKELKKARRHGLAYTGGVVLSFVSIAVALIALKATGSQIGWGFQLQNPAMILGLSYLFFLIGLNLAGFFEINLGWSNIGSSLTQKDGYGGSFFTGVLATLVATPCTAPFMGAAMGFALTQPAIVSLSVFAALGLGLALPYLALSFIPALRHVLPRPGAWMETFKQFLAFPMFAFTCWLMWILSQQTDHMGVFLGLLGMLAITFGFWLLKLRTKGKARAVILIAALISFGYAAVTIVLSEHVQQETMEQSASHEAEAFTQEKLDRVLKEGRPVFVNMTAAWCITCKVNERVALSVPQTKALFAEKNIRYFKGDWTNQNPEITSFLEKYGRNGVPLYVYYGPAKGKGGERPEAVVLPQILTPGIVKETLDPSTP